MTNAGLARALRATMHDPDLTRVRFAALASLARARVGSQVPQLARSLHINPQTLYDALRGNAMLRPGARAHLVSVLATELEARA